MNIRIRIVRSNKQQKNPAISNIWINMAGKLSNIWDTGNYE